MKNDINKSTVQNTTDDLNVFDIFKLLSKPLRYILSISLTLTGLSVFGIAYVIADFEKLTNQLEDIKINLNITLIILFVLALVIFLGIFLIACFSLVSLVRFKFKDRELKNDTKLRLEELSNNITRLGSEVTQLNLSKYILDETQITKLESSVSEESRIVVMTSKFHLDTGKLLETILTNIKKGVIYQYIVPGENKQGKISGNHHYDFITVYTNWWNHFINDLLIMEDDDQIKGYHANYQLLKKRALLLGKSHIKEIKSIAKNYFAEHVQEYLVSSEYSLITVIMYQKGLATEHNYDIIIKLPTVSDDNYYAFKIPDEEKVEKKNLTDIIEAFCRENPIRLKLN